jgi:hypothetical protein
MNSLTPVVLAILLFSVNLQAQKSESAEKPDSARGVSAAQLHASTQPPATAEPWEMEKWLNSRDKREEVRRLISLGVDQNAVDLFTSDDNAKGIEWKTIRTGAGQRNAILFLPCVRDDAYLYLLALENNSWRVIDNAVMDCHYDMSVSVEIEHIRDPGLDEVLMHHVGEGHGGSFSQQDFEVYAVANGKPRRELDAEEIIKVMQYVSPNVPMNEITQRSSFVLVPIENSRSRVIEETQSYQVNNKLSVKRRQFRWDAAKGRYLPTKFVPVEAARN